MEEPSVAVHSLVGLAMANSTIAHYALRCTLPIIPSQLIWPFIAGMILGGPSLTLFFASYVMLLTFDALVVPRWFGWCEDRPPVDRMSTAVVTIALNVTPLIFMGLLQFSAAKKVDSIRHGISKSTLLLLRDMWTPFHDLLGHIDELIESSEIHATRTLGGGPSTSKALEDALSVAQGCTLSIEAVLENVTGSAPKDLGLTVDPQHLVLASHISLSALTVRVRAILDGALRAKRQVGHLDWDFELSPRSLFENAVVHIDATIGDLLQIAMNLTSNASSFSPEGSDVFVHLCLGQRSGNRGGGAFCLILTVEDSGTGIPKETQRVLFASPESGRGRPGATSNGFGIGLGVAADCASRLNASLVCDDAQRTRGALFRVEVPVTFNTGHFLAESPRRINSVNTRVLAPVLIVDGDPLSVNLLNQLLVEAGFEKGQIHRCATCEEALQTQIEWRTAIVDLALPGPDDDSIPLLRMLTGARPTPAVVIATSASLSRPVLGDWRYAGPRLYLPKPIRSDGLASVLRRAERVLHPVDKQSLPSFGQHEYREISPEEQLAITGLWLRVGSSITAGLAVTYAVLIGIGVFVISLLSQVVFYFGMSMPRTLSLVARQTRFPFTAADFPALAFFVGVLIPTFAGNACHTNGYMSLPALFGAWHGRYWWVLVASVATVLVELIWLADSSEVLCVDRFGVSSNPATRFPVELAVSGVLLTVVLFHLASAAKVIRARSSWLHTMSHDIRAPLVGLLAALSDLEEFDSVPREILSSARASSTQLLSTATTHLEIVELSSTPLVARRSRITSVPLLELNQFVCEEVALLLPPELVDFRFPAPDAEGALRVRRAPLFYVLSKFLSGLPLLHGRGGAAVSLSVSVLSGSLALQARQQFTSGVAMPPGRNARTLFDDEPMFQRALCDVLGGSLSTTARVEDSWRLLLEIPVSLAIPEVSETPTDTLPLAICRDRAVVIVDDNSLQRRILEKALHSNFHVKSVTCFASSDRLLAACGERDFASGTIFFLDLNMPGVQGPLSWGDKLISKDCARDHHYRFIAYTGDVSERTFDQCRTVGFHVSLFKPFTTAELGQAITQALTAD
jgi:signal transduction histidine kinase/CheY-like chemotaxis protein